MKRRTLFICLLGVLATLLHPSIQPALAKKGEGQDATKGAAKGAAKAKRDEGGKGGICKLLIGEGMSAMKDGKTNPAMDFFGRAIEKGCKDASMYLEMALYYESTNNLEKALEYYKLAEQYAPKEKQEFKALPEHMGRVLFGLGRYDEAWEELTRAVQQGREGFTLFFLLGSIARMRNDDAGVINYYSKALSIPPPEGTNETEVLTTMLLNLGKSYYNTGNYEGAQAMFQRLLSISPNNEEAKKYLSDIDYQKIRKAINQDMDDKKILEEILKGR